MRMPALIATAALAACSQAPNEQATGETVTPAATPARAAVGTPTPTQTGEAAEQATPPSSPSPSPSPSVSPGKLPPVDAAYRYAGRWAARESLCKSGTWRFEPKRLVTAGEVSCDFDGVSKIPGGYDIAATCRAEGKTSKDTIQLRFAESAQAMLVTSKMWDVGLIYCGPE